MFIKKRAAVFAVLFTVILMLCLLCVAAGAEEGDAPQADSKTVLLKYDGQPIDVSALFDEQPEDARYIVTGYEPAAGELDGTLFTVTVPGSFRVVQKVGERETWISLGVHAELTVAVDDQTVAIGQAPASALDKVSVEGLLEGHTVVGVELAVQVGTVVGDHDAIRAVGITVMAGEEDVSSAYMINSIDGILHVFSSEWGYENGLHFHVCSAFECELVFGAEPHSYENACDAYCDVCFASREVPDHVYSTDCDETCNVCDKQREGADHTWGEAQVLEPATEESAGLRAYICTSCNQARYESIPFDEGVPIAVVIVVIAVAACVLGGVAFLAVRTLKKKSAEEKSEKED